MPDTWWKACKEGSKQYGSNPFLIAAVADVECNGWKSGRLGRSRYQGPMGFNRSCRIPDGVMFVPEQQIIWACKVLAGGPARLKKYNATWWENNYLRDVINLASRMEWQAKKMASGR